MALHGAVVGNRIAAVAGVPGDPSIYYAGAASGGVWKTTDGGTRWVPVFDSHAGRRDWRARRRAVRSELVWAGTGEAWAIRDSDVIGDGIYKSTDAGKTWTHMGLDETGRIGRILVHPTNPTSSSPARSAASPRRSRSAASFGRPTAAGLGPRAVRRREHRLLRPVDGREKPAHVLAPARGRSRCIPGRC